MCWEIIARVNLGEFGTFNATHCFGKHKRCAPNPFFHDRVIIPHDSTAGTTLAHVSDGLHTLCGPAMARRARVKLVTCTCGSCLAVSPNVVLFVYSLCATASRQSPMPCPCLSSCTLDELASCAHVGAASQPR